MADGGSATTTARCKAAHRAPNGRIRVNPFWADELPEMVIAAILFTGHCPFDALIPPLPARSPPSFIVGGLQPPACHCS